MKIVAICSGGLDSTVLFYYLKNQGHEVLPVNFNYGSRHNKQERARARKLIPGLLEIDIDLTFLSSSLILGGPPIPHGHYAEESMRSTVIPFRNGIMLAYAVAIAENLHGDAVALGSHVGDHAIYPDCRPRFTAAFNLAAEKGTYQGIQVLSPFNELSKGQIVIVGRDLGIEKIMTQTWTCYEGQEIHCGLCGACIERKEAFAFAGVEDTTRYRR